jgi:ribosome biogenesis GTPase
MIRGVVSKSTGSWYKVRTENGSVIDCRLKGKLKLTKTGVTNPIAVGDKVELELEEGQSINGLISNILDRDNYIIRKSVHKNHQAHILAANIDQLIVIASLTLPRTSLGFIDRLLVSAESYGIPAWVIFNKADLLSEEELEYVDILAEMYSTIGYPSIITSASTRLGIKEFQNILEGKTSLLSGHSGVGKSSLVNAIAPGLDLSTQEISTFANKGKHTTTYAEMFQLSENTFIVDTPGIKELGLIEMEEDNISNYFPEMRAISSQCKFHNCSHRHEPGCAILKAIDEGKLPLTRYESYLSMVDGDDNRR